MVRVIRLFIGYDNASQELVNLFKLLVDITGSEFRLDIYHVNTEDSDIREFIELSHEIFGGIFLTPLIEYSINVLPTIIAGRSKIIEGRFPNLDEIADILGKCGVYVDNDTLRSIANKYILIIERRKELKRGRTIRDCRKCFFFSRKAKLCLRYMTTIEEAVTNCSFESYS